MRVALGFALLAALLFACQPAPDERPATAARDAVAMPAAQIRFHPAPGLSELGPEASAVVSRHREQAKGVVVPAYTRVVPDELTVLNDTAHEVQTIARVRFYPRSDGGWTDTVWTRETNLFSNLLRATHEDYGLPVVSRQGAWLRVHYAYAADGTPRAGWVRLADGKTAYHDWDQQMFDFSTSLAQPETTEFYSAPNGAQVQMDLPSSHTLQVLRVAGDWIQVQLMQPDTSACTGDETLTVRRRDTVWVRRYNTQGLRQLQSAFAGC